MLPSELIASSRAKVEAVTATHVDHGVLAFGIDALDGKLAQGGLAAGSLHEFAGASTSLADDAAATLFIAGIAARFAAGSSTSALWATTRFDLYAPGLEQAGLKPADVLYAEAKDDAELLALMEGAVRDGSPAAVVGEVRRVSMVETRRLQLVAAETGVPVLLFRRWRKLGAGPFDQPSAAATRWRISCALGAAFSKRRRASTLGRGARPPARRRGVFLCSGGVRCVGSPRCSCRNSP